ncbi:MAG: PfaD family polyunsaturated fatty acid/polyketide biosynthesis protein [Desulfobacteraceae bacterium]|nr:PfaD family polyunsaturated fatty acid/polyketide biosynthesis protein [Desulfobacteraceae bacterium]
MTHNLPTPKAVLGWWERGAAAPQAEPDVILAALRTPAAPMALVYLDGRAALAAGGRVTLGEFNPPKEGLPLSAIVPPLLPHALGDPGFKKAFGLRYAYVMGAMANGITSVAMVKAAGENGMIGFFGAAGLAPPQVEAAIHQTREALPDRPFGFNLIHSPQDPDLELRIVELYLENGVSCISASAYLNLTLPVILYRVKGIHRGPDGEIVCPNKIIAKISRVEVASRFLAPPPTKFLAELRQRGLISPTEAELAAHIPVADALTAEADSGGHTDNRPALTLLPTMLALRDQITSQHHYSRQVWVGLGGGIATPQAVAGAFAMGAAFVLTGSINQACLESGTSDTVRRMLAEARQADVTMAPAADMFEMGVKVQVLKRGTMFPLRAAKLYDLYRAYETYDQIPPKEKALLEKEYFRCSFEAEWEQTRAFFDQRDPRQNQRADRDARHKMALVFRSYLGQSSNWANQGDPTRVLDYQIWCGPAMGAFNEWVKGSFLERPENRKVVTIAHNLLFNACVLTRYNWLQSQGAGLPAEMAHCPPLPLDEIAARCSGGNAL